MNDLEKVKGIECPIPERGSFAVKRRILFYEMDFLYLSEDAQGNPLVVNWTDLSVDRKVDCYLVSAVTPERIAQYFSQEISALEMLINPVVHLVYYNRETGGYDRYLEVKWSDLPDSYSPDPDSFYDPKYDDGLEDNTCSI